MPSDAGAVDPPVAGLDGDAPDPASVSGRCLLRCSLRDYVVATSKVSRRPDPLGSAVIERFDDYAPTSVMTRAALEIETACRYL